VKWRLPQREIGFPRRPLVMGIVNVNDDSFSGDGTLDIAAALAHAKRQAESGADLIDVGAESARTNRLPVAVAEEVRRLRAVLARWPRVVATARPVDETALWPPVVAINTWRPEVVASLLAADLGVELVNDMGALPDDRNARHCAAAGAALLIMHSVGEPKVPQRDQRWDYVTAALETFFTAKLALAGSAGSKQTSHTRFIAR